MTEEERCAEAKKLERIDAAFRSGDLDALRAAVDDPAVLPDGFIHPAIGHTLVYAIYRSPLTFIRTLLEMRANANAPADDGFPPLIAALSCARDQPGATKRPDVDQVLRLLLAHGADPNQRGINDYTPLHMAVGERNPLAVQILLDAGADPDLRTRIDDHETPEEMARSAGLVDLAQMLARRGRPLGTRLRSGLTLLLDVPGRGEEVRRQRNYLVRLRMWLNRGEPVRWTAPWGPVGVAHLEDEGETLVTELRTNRGQIVSGLFYGMQGMRVGGTRRLEMAPYLGCGERGVPGVIPPNAVLTAEITVLEAR